MPPPKFMLTGSNATASSSASTVTSTIHSSISKNADKPSGSKGFSSNLSIPSSSVSTNAPEGFYVSPTNYSLAVKLVLFSRAC